ncbi:MAG: tryptophan synthase subunit alpha [Bacteroidales bacterium]|nr:tryptophan synthase subunit alpha [Bacteroidales bacterium]
MNRINQLFQDKPSDILSVYFTAGHPSLDSTADIIKTLAGAGADMIEIGIPFSDPMADGPVIQKSSDKALKNGMSLTRLMQQLKEIRKEVTAPLLMMGYLNPVMQFGIDNFCRQCHEVGIDGVILPDLPLDLYLEEYRQIFVQYDLHAVFLMSPQTGEERIRRIDEASGGFVYMVSAASTTGVKESFSPGQIAYFERINRMNLKNPRLIGFGISNRKTFAEACKYAQGAIIGSAFIKILEKEGARDENIRNFIKDLKK